MAVHDRESLRVMVYERALKTVGRIVLGYKGRKIARERRRQVKLDEVCSSSADAAAPGYAYCMSERQRTCEAVFFCSNPHIHSELFDSRIFCYDFRKSPESSK